VPRKTITFDERRESTRKMFLKDHNRLIKFMEKFDINEQWHEPDNSGVTALVTGLKLDNAFGSNYHKNNQELTVVVMDEDHNDECPINLSTLLALATGVIDKLALTEDDKYLLKCMREQEEDGEGYAMDLHTLKRLNKIINRLLVNE